MKKKLIVYGVCLLALSLTVPWFFSGSETEDPTALPLWVTYAIVAAAGYAVLIATLIHFYWDTSASDNHSDPSE